MIMDGNSLEASAGLALDTSSAKPAQTEASTKLTSIENGIDAEVASTKREEISKGGGCAVLLNTRGCDAFSNADDHNFPSLSAIGIGRALADDLGFENHASARYISDAKQGPNSQHSCLSGAICYLAAIPEFDFASLQAAFEATICMDEDRRASLASITAPI